MQNASSISSVCSSKQQFRPAISGLQYYGPPSYGHYRIYQHTGRDPFPHPVTSSNGSDPMATSSRRSHKDQTHSGLSDYDSGPSISTKSANINQIRSLHPEIVNQIFGTWGSPTVDMFATVHVFAQFTAPILEPRALAIDAM